MGKSTISMVIFNSYVKLPEGNLGGSCKLSPTTSSSKKKKKRKNVTSEMPSAAHACQTDCNGAA